MKGINFTRVLLGGIAAGVVITLGEFTLWGVLLEQQYETMMASNGLTEASWAMTAYIGGSLALGLIIAFTYAAIRPRFGAGWQTAVIGAAVVWVVASVLPMLFNGAIGLGFGMGTTLMVLAWALAEFALAGVVAGRLYQEQEAPAPVTTHTY